MNPILLQKQLQENANDLQDFCKDLKSWGQEMKLKEDSVKNSKGTSKKLKEHDGKPSPKIKKVSKEKVPRIGSTDYSKWEKFDADLECARLEDDIKDDSELTDEFEESARDEALVHKEKGNSYVKVKEWDEAIDSYTKAINCYSYDPIFYANRALCYLKKNSFIAAEEDCTLSLRLDSTYVKALQRRAAAREGLGKLELAQTDLELVLTHEPQNKESTAALGRIRKKQGIKEKPVIDEQRPVSKFTASRSKIQPTKPIITNSTPKTLPQDVIKVDTSLPSTSAWPDPGCNIIEVKAINKPPHLRSQKPLKRIEIAIADNLSKAVPENTFKTPEAFKKHVVEHVKQVSFKEDFDNASEPVEKTSSFKKSREKPKNEKNEGLNDNAWPKASQKSDVIRSDDLRVLEKKPIHENKPKELKNTENTFITKNALNKEDPKEFPVPKTSVQFYSAWKTFRTSDEKYKYLKQINPQEIPNIFRESLESNVFSSFLEVLSTSFIEKEDDDMYEFLFRLTQVKRFSALAMFMDFTDKNRLWKMIMHLREKEKVSKEQADNLILEYEL